MFPTGDDRELPYPLKNPLTQNATVLDEPIPFLDLSEWVTNDSDERVKLVLELSLNEYVALATCVDVGRDIAFGENSQYLWWLWCKALVNMDFCSEIINCIENNADVRSAINTAVGGYADVNGDPAVINADIAGLSTGCDNDVIYGYCLALWDYIHGQNIDFLQQLAEASNLTESIDRLLRLIPGFEQVPISEVLQWISSLGDYNLEAYEASYTAQIRQDIICALFCVAIENNCTITLGDVYDYMLQQMGGLNFPNAGATFLEYVTFMVTGNYPSDKVIYIWTCVQLGLIFSGSEFLGISTLTPYALNAQAGNPDSDWQLFCNCVPVQECLNYLDNVQNDTTFGTDNNIFTATGILVQKGVGQKWRWRPNFNSPPVAMFNTIIMEFDMNNATWNNLTETSRIRYLYTDTTEDEHFLDFSPPFGQTGISSKSYTVPGPDSQKTLDAIFIQWDAPINTGNSGTWYVREVCFTTE